MKANETRGITAAAAAAAALLLCACASEPVTAPGATRARQELSALQSSELAGLAPLAIDDAEKAVRAAEEPRENEQQAEHLAYIAQRQVQIARASAEAAQARQQIEQLNESRTQLQLNARTAQVQDLQRRLSDLNAQKTDRGLVLTLGDVLFETGQAQLKPGAAAKLDKLADVLAEQQDRSVLIEGHTDAVGSETYNLRLSEQRAEAVKSYLIGRGIAAGRISTRGLGESLPVASNDTAAGRQQNRRVDIVIQNPAG